MAFHSNLEADYDPDYLDSKLKMQYLLSGKCQRENNYIFVKLMNQIPFCYLIAKPKNEVYFWLPALGEKSKLIQMAKFKNSNQNFANNTFSIIV